MSIEVEKIFVDIDETSAQTVGDGVFPIINQKYGTNFRVDTTLDYRDVFGDEIYEDGKIISLSRKIQIFNEAVLEDRGKNLIRPVEGSVEKIREFSEGGIYIGMATARHTMLTEYTPEWVAHHYQNTVSKVLFSNCYHGGKRTKSSICKEEGVRIMIEDDIDYALELARERVKVFLLRKTWNEQRIETHRNIERVDDWWGIEI